MRLHATKHENGSQAGRLCHIIFSGIAHVLWHATKHENESIRNPQFSRESPMCYRTPRTMKTWERTLPARLRSKAKQAGKMPALPGIFTGIAHVRLHATNDENGSRAGRPCHIFKGITHVLSHTTKNENERVEGSLSPHPFTLSPLHPFIFTGGCRDSE